MTPLLLAALALLLVTLASLLLPLLGGVEAGQGSRWQRWLPAGVISVLLPLAAVVLYVVVGDPQAAAFQQWAARHEAIQAAGISGEVTVAEGLRGRLKAGDTLFIVARSAEAGPMPVAVLRLPLDGLPLRFVLDDGDSLSPQRALSGFQAVTLEARISRSGQALRAKGDLVGLVPKVAVGSGGVRIVIEDEVR